MVWLNLKELVVRNFAEAHEPLRGMLSEDTGGTGKVLLPGPELTPVYNMGPKDNNKSHME